MTASAIPAVGRPAHEFSASPAARSGHHTPAKALTKNPLKASPASFRTSPPRVPDFQHPVAHRPAAADFQVTPPLAAPPAERPANPPSTAKNPTKSRIIPHDPGFPVLSVGQQWACFFGGSGFFRGGFVSWGGRFFLGRRLARWRTYGA